VPRSPVAPKRAAPLSDKTEPEAKKRKGNGGEKNDKAIKKPKITTTSSVVIDCSSPRKKYPREKHFLGSKYSLQVGDVAFRSLGINESTGKISVFFAGG
jgi:hypothetical protein